jgi:nucleoside-diphosphate-sugar epimerase
MILDDESGDGNAFNLGLTQPVTIENIAKMLISKIDPSVGLESQGQYRVSDTRHSWPDTSLVSETFGWSADVPFETGMDNMIAWLETLPRDDVRGSLSKFAEAEAYALKHGLPV